MRLTAIKLAGFKSFVDATTFTAPTNLTGIVGPNGCGKSNIIDAVRWVMGEGSAKVLRGESMADVIFSGSSSRKPVGTASVELVFDNSSGRIAGELPDITKSPSSASLAGTAYHNTPSTAPAAGARMSATCSWVRGLVRRVIPSSNRA